MKLKGPWDAASGGALAGTEPGAAAQPAALAKAQRAADRDARERERRAIAEDKQRARAAKEERRRLEREAKAREKEDRARQRRQEAARRELELDQQLLLAPAGRVTPSGVTAASDGDDTGVTPSGLGDAAEESEAITGATMVSGRTDEVNGAPTPARPAGPSGSGGTPAGKTVSLSALPGGAPAAAAPGGALAPGAGGPRPPAAPPKRADLLRVVDRVQKKDAMNIFRHPVTDDVAPGYTAVIKRPMDFTTIRARLDAGGYRSWDALADDMVLMFDNAMQFNRPDTVYHKQ
ncbi:hypothetical protein WJX81_007011, partial [Elliptochloris bilobata]